MFHVTWLEVQAATVGSPVATHNIYAMFKAPAEGRKTGTMSIRAHPIVWGEGSFHTTGEVMRVTDNTGDFVYRGKKMFRDDILREWGLVQMGKPSVIEKYGMQHVTLSVDDDKYVKSTEGGFVLRRTMSCRNKQWHGICVEGPASYSKAGAEEAWFTFFNESTNSSVKVKRMVPKVKQKQETDACAMFFSS